MRIDAWLRPTGTVALSWRHPARRRLPGDVEAALRVALHHGPASEAAMLAGGTGLGPVETV